MISMRLVFLKIIIIMIIIKANYSLRCRTADGPSDGELKRVARSCMRKFGDVAYAQSSQQQQHQQTQGHYSQRLTNRENYGNNYQDSDESDNKEFDDDQYYNNNNNNNNNNNERSNGHGVNNNGGHNDDRQRNRSRYSGNHQNRTNSGNNNNNQKNNRGNSNNNSNNRNNNNNNKYNNQNNSFTDAGCIVHCFFNEMHMLNNNDYPDRHKILFILTKDLRDRELRNFYTDTIQECFRYIENQRRRDTCQFSRDLITCMTEYAKGNCDDWNEFNMVFN